LNATLHVVLQEQWSCRALVPRVDATTKVGARAHRRSPPRWAGRPARPRIAGATDCPRHKDALRDRLHRRCSSLGAHHRARSAAIFKRACAGMPIAPRRSRMEPTMDQNAQNESTSSGSKERGIGGVAARSQEAAEQLKSAVAEQAEHVREKADTAREQAAQRFRRVASHLHQVGDTLRSDDRMASELAERASRGIEGVASYVANTDVRGLVRDTEQFARRQSALFFGGAFVLGLALGRFLKSSPEHGTSQAQPRRQEGPAAGTHSDTPPAASARAGRSESIPDSNGGRRAAKGKTA
jgi:hypothetical protein